MKMIMIVLLVLVSSVRGEHFGNDNIEATIFFGQNGYAYLNSIESQMYTAVSGDNLDSVVFYHVSTLDDIKYSLYDMSDSSLVWTDSLFFSFGSPVWVAIACDVPLVAGTKYSLGVSDGASGTIRGRYVDVTGSLLTNTGDTSPDPWSTTTANPFNISLYGVYTNTGGEPAGESLIEGDVYIDGDVVIE